MAESLETPWLVDGLASTKLPKKGHKCWSNLDEAKSLQVLPMMKYLAAMQMDRVLIMCESTSLPFFDKGRREPLRDDKVENFYSLCGNQPWRKSRQA